MEGIKYFNTQYKFKTFKFNNEEILSFYPKTESWTLSSKEKT